MKNRKKTIAVLLFIVSTFISLSITLAQPVTITLQPDASVGKDALIANCVSCGYDNTNFGNASEMNAIAWTYGGAVSDSRSLLQFDLASIPAGSIVLNASLSLYFDPASSNGQHSTLSGPNDAYLMKIIAPWNENTVTWNNQPGTSSINQIYLPQSASPTQDYLNMNATAMVQDFVNNPGQNYGMLFKLVTEQHYRKLVFSSSDHSNISLHPKLEITYISATNCISLQYAGSNGTDALLGGCVSCGYDNVNFGNADELSAIAWTYGGNISNSRSLIYWDLSFIPTNATITGAYLSLYAYNSPSNGQHSTLSGPNDAYLKKVTGGWNENTVTWNSMPSVTTANQAYLPSSSSSVQDYTNINISALVQDMVSNPSSNYGLMLQLATESYYRKLIFGSSDNADPAKRPKLDIYYTIPAVISPAGPTTFCTGGSVLLNANTAGPVLSYQWKKNNINISGATNSSYTATTSGNYKVTETFSCGSTTSAPVVVKVNSVPAIPGAISGSGTFCAYQAGVVYSVAAVAGATTYDWVAPAGATITNGQGTTSITVNFGNKNGYIKVRSGNACGNSVYRAKKVTRSCRESSDFSETPITVKIYPNPSASDFIFEFENNMDEIISIKVFDATGKMILSETIRHSPFIIHHSSLSPGIYSAKVIIGEDQKVIRIVKTE